MASLDSLVQWLHAILTPEEYHDNALNGLQVEPQVREVRRVAFAVDSGLSIIERAIAEEAQLLIVHHGLFWGNEQPLTGPLARKVELLFRERCALYASHLPLDGNREVGNGFELARFLGLEQIDGFLPLHGRTVGARGVFQRPRPLQEIVKQLATLRPTSSPLVLPFGKPEVRTVGVVTGSGSSAISLCAREGIDLLVSGEPKQQAYHEAKELSLNAVFAGHYATETFGVRALERRIQREFELSTVFIDEETGI